MTDTKPSTFEELLDAMDWLKILAGRSPVEIPTRRAALLVAEIARLKKVEERICGEGEAAAEPPTLGKLLDALENAGYFYAKGTFTTQQVDAARSSLVRYMEERTLTAAERTYVIQHLELWQDRNGFLSAVGLSTLTKLRRSLSSPKTPVK